MIAVLRRLTLLCVALCALSAQAAEHPRVRLETDQGVILVELYPEKAPKSVANFLAYVDSGFYDKTIFHRVIRNFVIQGGGMDATMREKPTRAPIANEAKNGLKNEVGTLAMARTSDPNSASSQFFINLRNNSNLDYPSFDGWGYAVFGKVVEGLAIVQKISRVQTGTVGAMEDVPKTPVVLKSARRVASAKK
jgi:cyclophilin family peptidyl-prolyl cis-trans isomerase